MHTTTRGKEITDVLVLVISPVQVHICREGDLERKQRGNDFDSLVAAVDKVAIEDVGVARAGPTSQLEYHVEIGEGGMEVADDGDRLVRRDRDYIGEGGEDGLHLEGGAG